MRSSLICVVACGALASACTDASDPAPGDDTAVSSPADGDVFTVTAVRLGPDGATVVGTRSITAREERAAAAARAGTPDRTTLIAVDPLCGGTSFQLFDQRLYVGNEICFDGTGVVVLDGYRRWICSGHYCGDFPWVVSTGSYIAGDLPGSLYYAGGGPGPDAPAAIDFQAYDSEIIFNVAPRAIDGLELRQGL
jgi:hypothetical protein